ncbi:uncharacterized protein [Bemisia tabaci]|uniref:uncharacterized protein n=1 Tax=Bemisia tabaci TaxID=7038 RepID=UPI003B283FC0
MIQTAGSVFVGAVALALATRGSVKGPFSLELNAVAAVIAALHALAVVPVFMCTFMPASGPPVRGAMERKIPLPRGYSTYKVKPSLDPNPRKFGGIPLHGMVSPQEVRPSGRGRPCAGAGAGFRRGFQRLDVVSDLGTSLSSSSEAEPDLTAPNPRCLRKTDGDVFFKEREHYVQSRIQCHACSVPRHLKPHFPFLSSAETWLPKR